jgi:nucleotide-binding universal stress UspA family protein
MTDDPFEHAVLPVADPDDASATARAALSQLRRADGRATLVHVVEKAGGAPDKAGVEQREAYAGETFAAAHGVLGDAIDVDERLAFGTDVAETIFEVADEVGATCITFTPRGGSRWIRLLTGDVALSLVTDTDRPVVVLPAVGDDEDAPETSENANADGEGSE